MAGRSGLLRRHVVLLGSRLNPPLGDHCSNSQEVVNHLRWGYRFVAERKTTELRLAWLTISSTDENQADMYLGLECAAGL